MPDDPFLTEMDPVHKLWLFNNWIEDQNNKTELAKDHAYLIGSFANPEMISKILDQDNKYESDDEAFEESLKIVSSYKKEESANKPKRRRSKLKG